MKVVGSRGSVLVMTMLFFIVFVVIMSAWMAFAVRQNNAVVGQEQEEQSFHLSEAGVHHVLHLLNNDVCTPAQLKASEPVVQTVVQESPAGGPTGTYELTFEVMPAEIRVRAVGYDVNVRNECQLIEARLEALAGGLGTKYRVKSWDHKTTIACGDPRPIKAPTC